MRSSTVLGRVALVALAAGLVVGCTSTSVDTRTAETSSTPAGPTEPTTTTTTTLTTPPFPPPPREIPLDDINPCDLWTPEQLSGFGLGDRPLDRGPTASGFGGQECVYFGPQDADPGVAYSLRTYPTIGLAEAADSVDPGARAVPVDVAGFPAVQARKSRGNRICDVLVSTATGQHLMVSVIVKPHELAIDEFCELSMAAAAAAIENLQDL